MIFPNAKETYAADVLLRNPKIQNIPQESRRCESKSLLSVECENSVADPDISQIDAHSAARCCTTNRLALTNEVMSGRRK
jgi:hypothetical protein